MTDTPTPTPSAPSALVGLTYATRCWLRNIRNNGGSIQSKDGPRTDLCKRMLAAGLIEERFPGRLSITTAGRSALEAASHG